MKSKRRIAAIGDIHGCLDELQQLLKALSWLSLDAIYHLGDLVDRGPDSGGVVSLCREMYMPGVLGNHEESILKHWDRVQVDPEKGLAGMNDDKRRTISQLKPDDVAYLKALPTVEVLEDLNTILVHGGLWPGVDVYHQPKNVVRCQMVRWNKTGDTRWWGADADKHKSGQNEQQNRDAGYSRWYEVYDHAYDVVYGHSVFSQPYFHKNEHSGLTIGVDTGSCFGGALTAAIIGDPEPWFVTIKTRKVHFEKSYRVHQE